MRKLFCLSLLAVLVSGVGCIITDYGLITDNDQVANGQGSGVVNTAGKAHIRESSQIATLWSDGSDEYIWFVDQNQAGDRTLTTYNNFSTGGAPTFHDDLYCNPDWVGCAISTSDDPQVGDVDIFDYNFNANCDGARSASILLGTSRYYGECGRARMSLSDRLALTNMGRIGQSMGLEGLFYDMNRSNTSITLNNNAGFVTSLPVTASATAFLSMQGSRKGTVDLTNPLLASMGRAYADFLANHATKTTTLTISYNGISMSHNLAGNFGVSNASNVLKNVNNHF
jgi:hypothetical protein